MKILSGTSGNRNTFLDLVKGLCVLAMLVNHSASIYSRSDVSFVPVLQSVSFVTSAFLFLSGFVVGWYYLTRYETDRAKTTRRLLSRAWKLVGLVIVLNAPILILNGTIRLSNPIRFLYDFAVLVIKDLLLSADRLSFHILLSIATVLMLGPIVLHCMRYRNIMVALLLVLFVATGLFYSPQWRDWLRILMGTAGILAGAILRSPALQEGRWLGGPRAVLPWVGLLAWYGAFYVIRIQDIPVFCQVFSFPVRVLVQTILVLICFYHLSTWLHPASLVHRVLALLGQYSLFSYIAQMLYITVFASLVPLTGYTMLLTVTSLAFGFLIGSCVLLDRLRQKRQVDGLYGFVFG